MELSTFQTHRHAVGCIIDTSVPEVLSVGLENAIALMNQLMLISHRARDKVIDKYTRTGAR